MKMFMSSLDLWNNDIEKWYDGLPKKGICSLKEFIKVFCGFVDYPLMDGGPSSCWAFMPWVGVLLHLGMNPLGHKAWGS